jgi:Arc/MetJ-type ribon-helix-helix transcriptional regulator
MAASTDTEPSDRIHRVGRDPRPHKKVSVTLPADLLEQIKERVGPGNLSRHLSEVLEDDERRRALREWLDQMDAEHGPIPADAVEEVRRRWPTAREVL